MESQDGESRILESGGEKSIVKHDGKASSLWKGTDYGKWLMADTCTSISNSIQDFAIPIIAQTITGSTFFATMTNAFMEFSNGLFRLPGGVVQDRFDRRKLMIIFGLSGCVIFGGAALLEVATSLTSALASIVLIVFAVILGMRTGLLGGTSNVMLRGIVPDELLPKAMSLNSGRDAAADLLGSPIGGMLISVGRWCPLAANAVLCGLEALFSLRIHRYWHHVRETVDARRPGLRRTASLVHEAFQGFTWLLTNKFQRRMLLSSATLSACFNAFLLITVLFVNESTGNAISAALMSSAVSVGVLAGSIMSSFIVRRIRSGIVVVLFYVIMTVGTLFAALVPALPAKMGFLALSILVFPAGNAVIGGFQSVLISKQNLGKVFAGMGVVEMLESPIISALAGLCSEYLGYRAAAIALALAIALSAVAALSLKGVISLPCPEEWEQHIKDCGIERF